MVATSDPRYRYFPLRIISIEGDQIRFKVGNIGHTEKVSVTKHVKFDSAMHRNFYGVDNLVVSKQQLLNLAETGVVYDIARP